MLSPLGYLPTLPSLLAKSNTPFIHRDLSWLQFNERVLNEARDPSNPLLERVKFLAISSSNLDEFFMIRFSSHARVVGASSKLEPEALERRKEIRNSILETVAQFTGRQADTLETLVTELESAGIFIVRGAREGDQAFEYGKKIFEEQILPQLSVPEPFVSGSLANLESLQSAVIFKGDRWIKIPKTLQQVYVSPQEQGVFVYFLDDLLLSHLENSALTPLGILRLTRDGDFSVDLDVDDPETIPDVVRTGLGARDKGKPVRLQYIGAFTEAFLTSALNTLKLQAGQLLIAPGSLCFNGLWNLFNQCPDTILQKKPDLKHQKFESRLPKIFDNPRDIFNPIKNEDILLHHPYDSFEGYVKFIQAACEDPNVLSIEQTVYRVDTLSPIIESLKKAAASKTVRVVIELRARFDELNNLRLADELKKAGVHVAFGFGKLKLHAKIALVTRRESNGMLFWYTHLSTGNYNVATSRVYTDLAILTSRPEVGQDARHFFDCVMQEQLPTNFKHLVAAPTRLHRRLLSHIQSEAEAAKNGQKARIVAKVNALVDEEVVENLYRASQAGVQIDLIVRGACSLIPGIAGFSDNIRVISVIDRFLEHSRVYYFGHSKVMYLSSADWMPRNFFSRLELAFPVNDPVLFQYLEQIVIPTYLSDHLKARELTPLGTWKKRTAQAAKTHVTAHLKNLYKGLPLRSQFLFESLAKSEYQSTPLAQRVFSGLVTVENNSDNKSLN